MRRPFEFLLSLTGRPCTASSAVLAAGPGTVSDATGSHISTVDAEAPAETPKPGRWTDAHLLSAAADGDGDAFRRLVERHQRRLLTVAERLLGDTGEAEDVVQESFFAAYTRAHRFAPGGEVGAWLYRIVVNACLKRLRRRRLVRWISADRWFLAAPPVDDRAVSPWRELEARERWRRTRSLIDGLPPSQRTVLVLARFEGQSMRSIAELLGISEKAAESRLGRALERLRRRARP